ncbi:MAG: alpha/beta hydrolase family esterase [Gammaproteobacteria bacterium]
MLAFIRRLLFLLLAIIVVIVITLVGLYVYVSTRTNGALESGGETRRFLLHVPASYDAARPMPLVISLHGAFLYPRFQMRLTEWNDVADREGFIVVYPKAAGFPPLWHMKPGEELVTEVQFFRDLIDHLSVAYNIDQERIYVNGFSNGAAMTFMLSCELADRIAAFGMVATPVVPWDWCAHPSPVPMIAMHGVDDPFAPYRGGENFLTTEPLQTIEQWTASWAERNRCDAEPLESTPRPSVVLRQFASCDAGSTVALYSINDAGHVWPGGMRFPGDAAGPNSDAMQASDEMWRFFVRHPRVLRGQPPGPR